MKSNTTKKTNNLNFLKPIMIASLILVILASVVVGIWGFNTGFDFTGGTQLVVDFGGLTNIDMETKDGYNLASKGVNEVLNKHHIRVNSFQTQGEFDTKCFVITFKNLSQNDLQDLRLDINKKFNTTSYFEGLTEEEKVNIVGSDFDLTGRTTFVKSLIVRDSYILTIAGLLFILSLITFYACFRFKGAGAVSICLSALFDIIMTLTFVALSRIEINSYIFTLMAVILACSLFASINFMFEIKDLSRNPIYSEKNNQELVKIALKNSWVKNIILYFSAFICALILGAFGVNAILHSALVAFAGLIVVFASHIFVLPEMWATFCKNREKIAGASLIKGQKSSQNMTVVEEDDDEDAYDDVEVEETENNNESNDDEQIEIEVKDEDVEK